MKLLVLVVLVAALESGCFLGPTLDWRHCSYLPGPDGRTPPCTEVIK